MLQLLLHILGYDLWFYLSHLLLHTPLLYRAVHKKHHEIIQPIYKDTYYGHWFESPFQSIGFLLPWAVTELDYTQFAIALVFVNVRGILRHETRLGWLLGNHHLLHHQLFRCNYGEYWLDKMFNTHCKDMHLVHKGLLHI